jgi:hypothetical protein
VRAGQTFNVNADGSYTGLLTGKKATVNIASSGEYRPGTPTAQAFAEHHGKLVSLCFPKTESQDFGDVAVLYSLVRITWRAMAIWNRSAPIRQKSFKGDRASG